MRPGLERIRKAPEGAFFRFALLLFCGFGALPALATECSVLPFRSDAERVQVKKVYDGDTLTLKDGRRIRLLGINTPELAHGGKPAEPLGKQSRQQLKQILGKGPVFLLVGKDAHDHYGRVLGHVFDAAGESVSAQLLRLGAGFAVVIPPNTRLSECYQEAELFARSNGLGVWGNPFFQPVSSASTALKGGYIRVTGVVQRVSLTKKVIWVDLEGDVTLKIDKKYSDYVSGAVLDAVMARSRNAQAKPELMLEARGWMSDRLSWKGSMPKLIKQGKRKRFQLNIQHRLVWSAVAGR